LLDRNTKKATLVLGGGEGLKNTQTTARQTGGAKTQNNQKTGEKEGINGMISKKNPLGVKKKGAKGRQGGIPL